MEGSAGHDKMSRKKRRQSGKSAVGIIEEATHLLRILPASIFIGYYVGSLPFVAGFLYFWADMSRDAFAYRHAAEASFVVAVLFVWMKCLQAVFAEQLSTLISNGPSIGWSIKRVLRLIVIQTAVQPTGLLTLPVAALALVPLGWTYAFYQNVTVLGGRGTAGIGDVCRKSFRQAMLFQAQNHILLSILSLFGFFVFLNTVMVMFMTPHMLNTFFGIETVFTRAGLSMFNTTFFAAALVIVYVLVDPLMKAIYTLRCFYGESLHTGEDLLVELKGFQTEKEGLRCE